MSRQLDRREAEAILRLRGADEEAFNTLISYFERRYDLARDKCVDSKEYVQLEQGRAKAFKEIKDIEEAAEDVLSALKN